MIQVSVQVRSGAARLRVNVRAESIERAESIVGGRYPGGDVKVLFPIDPESFFVGDRAGVGESVDAPVAEALAG